MSTYFDSPYHRVRGTGRRRHPENCDIHKIAVSPLPICMPNGEIITSTHTALLSKTELTIEARKENIFPGLNKALL